MPMYSSTPLCPVIRWALDQLASGGDWRDRSHGLTSTGKSTALEALGARATGPRTIPWP